MAKIKNQNELILSRIERLRLLQPNLDSKPGTVVRDVFIENPAIEAAKLYDELGGVQNAGSFNNSLGSDLEKLAANFDVPKQKSKSSTGPALLLFSSLDSDIGISSGSLVFAKNGVSFRVVNGLTLSVVNINRYKSIASKYRADLDFLGLTETMGVEILVECTTPGIVGNISKYFLSRSNIVGITSVTNVVPFGGGLSTETDAAFRNRILSSLAGSVAGSELGYKNAILTDPDVSDAVVISPGDELMTRDGTQIEVSEDGTKTILAEGTGGKVDIYVLGSRLQETSDSFIYRDKSNSQDPSKDINNYVLGQILGDENKTVTRRRRENLLNGILPSQPINNIISVSGSLSGPNFRPKSIDQYGRISGNYELLKDTGEFAGSPWGFDALHWISSEISGYSEDKNKSSFNSQDSLNFTGVTKINQIQQNISITNEPSKISSSDRSVIQLLHYPVSSVTRVVNSTTGERYTVIDQNPDSDSDLNLTGRIRISGKTLPLPSDILQVDYLWNYSFDSNYDFDNLNSSNNFRDVGDSVDWGYSNLIRQEISKIENQSGRLVVNVIHPVFSVFSVSKFQTETGIVTLVSDRLAVILSQEISNIDSVTKLSGLEVWNSSGTFKNQVLFLPNNISFQIGEVLNINYNSTELFDSQSSGNFQNNQIFLSSGDVGTNVQCTYLTDFGNLISNFPLQQLPLVRQKNNFISKNQSTVGYQPTTHRFQGADIIQNLRCGPTNLSCSVSGSFTPFTLTLTGTTIFTVQEIVFRVPFSGLKIDLSSVLRTVLGISSVAGLPANLQIHDIISCRKVLSADDLTPLEVLADYDLLGSNIYDNTFCKQKFQSDSLLKKTEFQLPDTEKNLSNLPIVGETLQISFYYSYQSDSENLNFLRSGTIFSQKKFAQIDSVFISSGSLSAAALQSLLTIGVLNQPTTKSRYKIKYNYLAPKQNERITVDYNYQKLITDNTLQIEKIRTPGSDILIKQADPILVDVSILIVVTSEVKDKKSSATVIQNVRDAVTNAMTTKLGGVLDASDLLVVAGAISGVDRVRVTYFNQANQKGSVLSIQAEKNQYLTPNDVNISLEERV